MCGKPVVTRKFQYAYHQSTGDIISAEKAMLLKAADLRTYISNYQDGLFCPKCKQARICLVRGNQQPFFRTCPKSVHADNCILSQDELLPSEVDDLIKDEQNIFEVRRQMERVLSLHFSGKEGISVSNIEGGIVKTDVDSYRQIGKRVSKYIPQKNITTKFSEGDINVKKIFYGDVEIEWERGAPAKGWNQDGSNRYYMKLLIRTPVKEGKQKFLCRLSISPTVYSHLPLSILHPSRYSCSIVYLSELSISKNKDYLTGWLFRSEFIRIEKMIN